jgi:hypothetical protein
MSSFRRIVRRDSWWATLSVGVALIAGVWMGYWAVWVGYAVFNAVGLILYLDGLDVRRARLRRRARVVQVLAVPLLPIGIVGLLVSNDPGSPGTHAMGDEPVRRDAAAAIAHGNRTGIGGGSPP